MSKTRMPLELNLLPRHEAVASAVDECAYRGRLRSRIGAVLGAGAGAVTAVFVLSICWGAPPVDTTREASSYEWERTALRSRCGDDPLPESEEGCYNPRLAAVDALDWCDRVHAVRRLREMRGVGVSHNEMRRVGVIHSLTHAMRDTVPNVRLAAVEALSDYGANPSNTAWIVDLLSLALSDDNPVVRAAAAFGLGSMGEAAAPAAGALFELLRRERNGRGAVVAASALIDIGRADSEVTAALVNALDAFPRTARYASHVLVQWGDAQAIPLLLKVLEWAESPESWEEKTLVALTRGPGALHPLVALLDSENWVARRAAAKALAKLGCWAWPALTALTAASADISPAVRREASAAADIICRAVRVGALAPCWAVPVPAECPSTGVPFPEGARVEDGGRAPVTAGGW